MRSTSHARFILAPALAFALALAACGDGGSSGPVDTGGPNPCGVCPETQFCSYGKCVPDPGLAAGGEATCDYYGYAPTNQAAFARFAGGQTRVRYVTSNVVVEPPFDKLVLEMNQDQLFAGGAPVAGEHDLVGTEQLGAPLFLRGYAFCNDFDCASTFVATQGTLELTEPGAPGTALAGVLRDLRLKQVRIDAVTGDLIEFSKGKVWCVGDYRFATDVPALKTAEGTCVADGTGIQIGDNIRNFTLQNCYGDFVDFHDRCGRSKAVWIVASAGWCSACEAFVPEAAARAESLADQGLDLMVVLGENQLAGPPSLEYCLDYATAKGADPAQVFIDNDGSQGWPVLFSALDTYTDGSIGLPWNAVLDGASMEYIWSSNAGSGDLYSVQDALLGAE
ncbi:MAG: hypothetical protein EP329_21520 [Deltaproteobacteria bacterium]|nr:MAG: hypothetical protein EP329_21520 [Deltaproteobacteria bacterium]